MKVMTNKSSIRRPELNEFEITLQLNHILTLYKFYYLKINLITM